jgi:hypothetical protein
MSVNGNIGKILIKMRGLMSVRENIGKIVIKVKTLVH